MKERFKLIPEVYLLLIKGDKILLSRRFCTGYEDGNYGLPAGHAEAEETLKEALIREAREEINIKISMEDLDLRLTMHRSCGDHERVGFFFTTKGYQEEIKNMEENKCDDLQWFPLKKLPLNTISYIGKAIECYLKQIPYCEFGWKK